MSLDRDALRQRLLASFRIEAEERLGVLADDLANWREATASVDSVESLFREVHSLKGAARAAGVTAIEQICHAWESLLAAVRHGRLNLTPERVELSRRTLKAVQRLHVGQTVASHDQQRLIECLEAAAEGDLIELPEELPPAAESLLADLATVRVSAQRLDTLLFQSEVLLQHKLEARVHARSLQAHMAAFEPQRTKRLLSGGVLHQLREDLDELPPGTADALKGVLDYLDWSLLQLDRLHFNACRLARAGNHLAQGLEQLSGSLNDELQQVLLLSGSALVEGFPTMVQDLASVAGKRVDMEVKGASLQADKRILDELRIVLTHLLRNAIDHGLERPEVRSRIGKEPTGRLGLELIQESADRFELRVSDDGAGLDLERLKSRAVSSGLLSPDQAKTLTDREAGKLIFTSGLSTSQIVTDLSGRGLGMAIVQETVERLGGRIEVESRASKGTCFHVHLPLSLSTFRAVIVRNAERVFAVPALAVERCLRLPPGAIKNLENRPTVTVSGEVLPLWTLAEVLGLDHLEPGEDDLTLLLLKVRGERFVLLVEELLGDQEIIVKGLGRQLVRVRNLLGATVLGDGQLVPILHPADLYRSALETQGSSFAQEVQTRPGIAPQRLLIAEDSFTSRGLLKAILEGAGYQVTTANNGLEAWNALKQGQFDLLVSDVEMPRLDGFTLTSRIRADRALAGLPVVLVTALHSAEDRARGLESGANAYLVKSGFEQDSLLDAIRRLI
ncbi:hybrid sensor histidine kinase/response regulator [Pseudomonas sp. TCU-HL1]|uniref:hybrid sensor histidine kinase/response regulator n=1 Tax=Pseudomonas sp. TCU-HL1 TaxID=1856685 RepID=UPI00083D5689|nr:response regulator [Pseudomonas sp. TCU-HL1]AOE83141.1 chemotaxis protein CheA [Pseudomonas sp. TCU-HL1]